MKWNMEGKYNLKTNQINHVHQIKREIMIQRSRFEPLKRTVSLIRCGSTISSQMPHKRGQTIQTNQINTQAHHQQTRKQGKWETTSEIQKTHKRRIGHACWRIKPKPKCSVSSWNPRDWTRRAEQCFRSSSPMVFRWTFMWKFQKSTNLISLEPPDHVDHKYHGETSKNFLEFTDRRKTSFTSKL